ncbi:uncharacterized protein LOC131038924 isoform X2 [Cryptomeria japonica]|uniref:uncharacterized protein LOC131038924 isoform X2 n=1 Tax=Cryptomeria japonica TaxID=3369 RepID=UPI0027DA919A|nr:uncharacterized protein LOC131038924 isoform X2 [Cryptomeria japonica]
MDSHSPSHSSPVTIRHRSRFQISPSPHHNNNNKNSINTNTKSSSGRFEFGAAGRGTLTADQPTGAGTNNFSLYTSSISSLNTSKSAVPSSPPLSFDALMFEAMDKNSGNNNASGSSSRSSKVSKVRQGKSGRRSSGRVLPKEVVHSDLFQSADQPANFDQFLFDRSKSSMYKHTYQKVNDNVVFDRFSKLEPFRAKIDRADSFVSISRHSDDDDREFSLNEGHGVRPETKVFDSAGSGIGGIGSKSCNGRLNAAGDAVEVGDLGSFKHKASVFGAQEAKLTVGAENPGKSQSGRVYGESEALDGDWRAARRPAFEHRTVASGSSLNPVNNIQVPLMSSSSLRVRSDSKAVEKESLMRDSLVGQSESFGSIRSATSFTRPGVSFKDVNKQTATEGQPSRGGTISAPSPRSSSIIGDSPLQKSESLHSSENLSSTLNHAFQFGAKKGASKAQHGTRKMEDTNVSYSSSVSVEYQSDYHGGGLKENTPFKCDNTTYSERSSMHRASPFHSGETNQHNLHQSDRGTNAKEAMSTNANLQTDIDEQTNAANICNQESPTLEGHQFQFGRKGGREYTDPAISSKWISPSFNQQVSVSSFSNGGLNHQFEKVRTDKCESRSDNAPAIVGASIQRRRSASKPLSGQSFSASGHARKCHRSSVEVNTKSRTSVEKFESSAFALRPLVFQTDAIQSYASSLKGDLFDSNQLSDEGKNTLGSCERHTTVAPESRLADQSAKSDLPAIPMAVKNSALEQACESWRHRGNQAYTEGLFSKAEEYYSRGISCVSPNESSEGCVKALLLCYSNRAATRMAISRVRAALFDCMQALKLDPNFVKARIRAASCYLALGEYELALTFFNDCLKSVSELETMESKLASEASEGIRKTQQVEEKMVQAVKLLTKKKLEDASNSLSLVNELLLTSPHSEKLLELKTRALLSLCKYEDVIQLCEEGWTSFNQNHYCGKSDIEDQMNNVEAWGGKCNCPIKLQLLQMNGKAQFYLGRLDEALTSLSKYEEANITVVRSSGQRMETLAPLIATIRDLLHHKAAGNEAFQANKFAEAEKHYTAALSCNTESRPFTAVCFCNRAAASHAQGHIADAIADCSRAMALDSKYLKAISRRSILHNMIRNYGQAISDLERLITLQEIEQRNVTGGSLRRTQSSCSNAQDLKDARERLSKAQEDMKKGIPLDHYLILGVDPSSTAAEIKKAYRKAALKHHPDKFLVRSDAGEDEILKECGDEVRRDAEKLFQMIAEAYAILSDPGKRLRYDAEEELWKLQMTRSTSMTEPESQSNSYQFEKTSRQHREGWDAWKDYENQYHHWQSHPEGFRTDNCAHQGPKNDGVRWNDHKWSYI